MGAKAGNRGISGTTPKLTGGLVEATVAMIWCPAKFPVLNLYGDTIQILNRVSSFYCHNGGGLRLDPLIGLAQGQYTFRLSPMGGSA